MQENMWARLCDSPLGACLIHATYPTYFPAFLYNALTIQGISSVSLVACEPLPSGLQNLNIQLRVKHERKTLQNFPYVP